MATRAALSGRRVLDLAGENGVYCGKLLADMGADVIKVEPPGGDAARALPPFVHDRPGPDASLFFLYMNTSKRGITLDLTRPEGQVIFKRLASTADVVLETFQPGHLDSLGLGYADLRLSNPRLVLTSITGFGQTGPRRQFASSDLIAAALGGAMYVTGDADDPPVRLAGHQAGVTASVYAAASTMIALFHSARTGEGQHVDVSLQEATVSATHICGVGKWLDDGIIPRRSGTTLFASVPSGTYQCRDGLVYLMINRPLHWKALAEWIHEVTGNDAARDPMFEGPSSNRQAARDVIDSWISELAAHFTVADIYREGQRRHLAFTPVNTASAVARDPHLAARDFFVDIEHRDGRVLRYPGPPYRLAKTPWRISRPAPAVGQHNEDIYGTEIAGGRASPDRRAERDPIVTDATTPGGSAGALSTTPSGAGALAGLRIFELTAAMAGPWIGRFMAACGAEVIRVESRQHPDVVRLYVPPWAPELGTQPQPWFTDWNAGKRFIALDLRHPKAVELCRRLVARCDVVVENNTAGVIDKLGLGYEELRRVRPDLVMLGTSGYGDAGPCRSYVTWGPNIEALSGMSTVSGFAERACTITQYAYPDVLSAVHGLFAVMCALDHRRRTGEGQYINLAQLETAVAAIGDVMMEVLVNDREPERLGNRAPRAAPHGCYPCRGEDRWCAIAVASEAEWQRFCDVVEEPGWKGDPRFSDVTRRLANADVLDRMIAGWTAARTADEVMASLQSVGIAAGVVQNIEDLARRDPHVAARGLFEEIEHAKKGRVTATAVPLGLTATPTHSGIAGAAVGQDNAYVFGELLGMTAEEIRACVETGAIEDS